jgi:hypothetical protein
MKPIIDLLFGLGLCISLAGLGGVIAHRVFNFKSNFYLSFLLGCGIAIVVLFTGGLLGLFSRPFFISLLILLGLFIISGYRRLSDITLKFTKNNAIPLVLVAILLIFAGLAALSPPIKNDTLYYHLGLPKLWAISGGILFYPTIAFSATALNGELLVTPIVAIISPEAAQFFVFLIALITILYLGHELERFTNTPSYLGLIFIAALPLYIAGLSDSKNDYLAAGFCLAAIFSYFDYTKIRHSKYLIMSGVFAGLAAGTKSNALIFAIALTIGIFISRPRLKDFACFVLGATIFTIPWYLKAYLETGNPVYPFYNGIFHSPFWPNAFNDFNEATMPPSVDRTIVDFILSPFKLVYWPDLFRGRIGPFPLIFLPFLIIIKNHPKIIKRTLIVAAVYYVIWYAIWANARYLLPAVLLLIFVAAYAAYRAAAKSRSILLIVTVMASLLIAINIVQLFRDSGIRVKAAAGMIDRDTFLERAASLDPNNLISGEKVIALPYFEIWQRANTALPKNAIVGILCSNWSRADGFYLDRRFMYINPTEQKVVDFGLDSIGLENTFRQSGIDYFLIDNQVIQEFSGQSRFADAPEFTRIADGVRRIVQYTQKNGRLEFQTDRYQLYGIR